MSSRTDIGEAFATAIGWGMPIQSAAAAPPSSPAPAPAAASATRSAPAAAAPAATGGGGGAGGAMAAMSGGGMGLNYGQGISSIFTAAGDVMQHYADEEAKAEEKARVKAQKSQVEAQYKAVQAAAELERQKAAVQPSAEQAGRVKLAQDRMAAVEAQRQKFYQRFPEERPKDKNDGATVRNVAYAVGVLALGGVLLWGFAGSLGRRPGRWRR